MKALGFEEVELFKEAEILDSGNDMEEGVTTQTFGEKTKGAFL